MSTMLSGAAVMDAALLLIAGNETCPQPQTSEHLAAIEIMKLNHIVILQNKVDLMREENAQVCCLHPLCQEKTKNSTAASVESSPKNTCAIFNKELHDPLPYSIASRFIFEHWRLHQKVSSAFTEEIANVYLLDIDTSRIHPQIHQGNGCR